MSPMRTPVLLDELKRLGVVLTVEGDKLKYKAPAGVLTDELKAEIRAHKPALLALLGGQADAPAAADPFKGNGHVIMPIVSTPDWLAQHRFTIAGADWPDGEKYPTLYVKPNGNGNHNGDGKP